MTGPIYRQIAEELRRRIESGELPPGSQLPTELELREMFDNASRNTVRDAIRSLVTRGLVVTRAGQGTFVVERMVPFAVTMSTDSVTGLGGGEGVAYMGQARAQRRTPEATLPRVEIQTVSELIGRELRLDPGAQVVSRHQRLRIDGKPWSLQTSFYPMSFVEQGASKLVEAKNIEPGAVKYVGETLNLKQVGYRDQVLAARPLTTSVGDAPITGQLSLSLAPGLRTQLTDLGIKGLPLEKVLVDYLCQGYAITGPLDLTGGLAFDAGNMLGTLTGPGQMKVGRGKVVGSPRNSTGTSPRRKPTSQKRTTLCRSRRTRKMPRMFRQPMSSNPCSARTCLRCS